MVATVPRVQGLLWAAAVAAEAPRAGERPLPPRAVRPASPGLSLGYNSTHLGLEIPLGGAELKIANGANCVHLRRPKLAGGLTMDRAKRGTVKGLSRSAAARCKRLLLSVDQLEVQSAWFGCNTIPAGEFTFSDFRRFLKNWRERVSRQWPGAAFCWVKELTAAGEPHLHFVVVWPVGVFVPTLRRFRSWNDAAWAEVVQSSHPSHKLVGCRVELVQAWGRVVRYLSSYLTAGSEGRDRQCDTGRMWGVIGRKFLPSSWKSVVLGPAENCAIARALCRYRCRQVTWLRSSRTHNLKKSWGRPVEHWRRFKGDPTGCNEILPDEVKGFWAERVRASCRDEGWRLRVLRPRPYRREVIEKLWVGEVGTCKVERSPFAVPKWVTRPNKLTGVAERVQVDEVNHVPSSWHYLPSSEVERLLAFVRRDRLRGLTSCERRWADAAERERAIVLSRSVHGA